MSRKLPPPPNAAVPAPGWSPTLYSSGFRNPSGGWAALACCSLASATSPATCGDAAGVAADNRGLLGLPGRPRVDGAGAAAGRGWQPGLVPHRLGVAAAGEREVGRVVVTVRQE